MNRTINIKVKGNHLTKDSNNAGTRGEANVTTLRITFGDDWNSYVKKILFWDAHGMNPTKYTLVHDGKEPANVYLHNIPKSALGLAGDMTFRIDGCIDNKRQVSVSATLEVGDALIVDGEEEIPESDLDNVTAKIEELKQTIINGVNDTGTAAGNAKTSAEHAAAAQTAAQEAAKAAQTAQNNAETAMGVAQNNARWAVTACGDAQKAQKAAEGARDDALAYAENFESLSEAVLKAEKAKEDAETAQGKAEEAKRDAATARDDARGYAKNFESLVEAVSKAENAKEGAAGSADAASGFKGEAETSASNAAQSASNAAQSASNAAQSASNAKTSETNAKTYEGYALAYKNSSNQAEIAAWQHKADAEKAQTAAETAERMAESKAFAALESAINAATSEANAKTYADKAENAVSQSRYIGANGNWYVWNESKKAFVDSGETAHAGSTVYVGGNPPSNAQVWIEPDDDSDIAMSIKEIYNTIKSMKPKAVTITLLSSAWVVDGDRYAQIVSIPEATAYSKVDLQPSAEQLTIFHEKDIAFVTENVGGTITVYCIGQKPTNDYTIQATITEVIK